MKTKIINTCATCIFWKEPPNKYSTIGTCRKNSPQSKGWPETDFLEYCGEYEPWNDQCQSCKFLDKDRCGLPFQRTELTQVNESQLEDTCRLMSNLARRMPCKQFEQKQTGKTAEGQND